jgi:dienelactone hydrolase
MWRPRRTPLRRPTAFGRDDRSLSIDLVVLETKDRKTWDGLLYSPRDPGLHTRSRPAVLVVHGSVGNYLSGVPRRVSFGLARTGYTVLSVNTRMANYGVFFGGGLLDEVPLDLDAALTSLTRRGFKRVVLLGYSLGATMVTHYQALRQPPEVVGLCTVAHPLSLPASLRRRWERFGASPSYEEVEARAREMAAAGEDEIVIVTRSNGLTDEPKDCEIWTYRTWWASRGPEAPHAESARRIREVRVPIAVIQGEDDVLIPAEEGEALVRIALEAGCPDARLMVIPGADHGFRNRGDALAEACAEWIGGLPE